MKIMQGLEIKTCSICCCEFFNSSKLLLLSVDNNLQMSIYTDYFIIYYFCMFWFKKMLKTKEVCDIILLSKMKVMERRFYNRLLQNIHIRYRSTKHFWQHIKSPLSRYLLLNQANNKLDRERLTSLADVIVCNFDVST